MTLRIKKGDKVQIIAGKDKGKQGEVLRVIPDASKLVVTGVNLIKKHVKPSRVSEGGIVTREAPLHYSNVALLDPKDGKPTRYGVKVLDGGRKVRYAKHSGDVIDV